MFRPPFCPHPHCANHQDPPDNFWKPHGSYRAQCRACPIPRFKCRACRRTFSRQTFRYDYRDKRPSLNVPLLDCISKGVGIRMSSRRLGLSLRCTELKLRKMARHLRQLNLNLRRPLEGHIELQFDEIETFEGSRSLRPLTVPVLIEKATRFYIWAESATIRPKGRMTKSRLRKLAIEEAKHGLRRDRSRSAVRRTMSRGREFVATDARVTLYSDEKLTYPGIAREVFGSSRLTHLRTHSKLARTTANPLFPINHEDARMRDMMGRLRRQSWLASKSRRFLDHALQVQMAFRNLIQSRFNFDRESPAQLLGFLPRRLRRGEALSWSQKWGRRSLHPLSPRGRSVANYMENMSM